MMAKQPEEHAPETADFEGSARRAERPLFGPVRRP
jgi:hypothetical protein